MQKPLILDHDIGTNPDDFFALLMLLNSESVDLSIVISGNAYPLERARFAHKIITQSKKSGVRSFVGEKDGRIDFFGHRFIEKYEPALEINYTKAIKDLLDEKGGAIYLCIQGLSNLAKFAKEYPEDMEKLDIVHMGMTTSGVDDFIGGGTNMEADLLGAKYIYELGLTNFRVVGSHTSINDAIRVHPETDAYRKLEGSKNANHKMLLDHLREYNSRRGIWSALHDALAVSVVLGGEFVSFEEVGVEFNDEGKYRLGGGTKVLVTRKEISESEKFMSLVTELL